MTVREIMNNTNQGVNAKAMELFSDIRPNYVYDKKSKVGLIAALERVKENYKEDKDIAIILNNSEQVQKKYAQEIENKREFGIKLNNIKADVEKMQAIHNIKIEDLTRKIEALTKDNEDLKNENERLRFGKTRFANDLLKRGMNNNWDNNMNRSVNNNEGYLTGNNSSTVRNSTNLPRIQAAKGFNNGSMEMEKNKDK